jgi:hypothetical protein
LVAVSLSLYKDAAKVQSMAPLKGLAPGRYVCQFAFRRAPVVLP